MVLERIRQLYPQLSKSQKRLADFIATNYREVAFMTASKLAREVGINEATVIRFAQRLDYQGYPELVAAIQEIIKGELMDKGREPRALATPEPILQTLASENEALRSAISIFPIDTAVQVLAALRRAKTICIMGQGMAAHLAGVLDFGLRAQGYPARLVPADVSDLAAALSGLSEGDAVIGFCVDEVGTEIANALRYAAQARCTTIAFSCSAASPVAQAAELVIACPPTPAFMLPSVTVLVAFVDILLQALASGDPERSRQKLQQMRYVALAVASYGGEGTNQLR